MQETHNYITRQTCRLCACGDLEKVVALHPLPVASPNVGLGTAVPDVAPADLWQCQKCGFLQLRTVVNSSFQYRNFRYTTGISVGLRAHFKLLVDDLYRTGEIKEGTFVFDIGSNDGSLLAYAKAYRARILGIDPADKIAKEATKNGIPTIGNFFTSNMAKVIQSEHGQADLIISANTVANIDDLDDLFHGIDIMLAPDGLLVIETQYALDVLQKTLLDVIYHEHSSYFSVGPMQSYLAKQGFELINAERITPKGGSIRFYAQHSGAKRTVNPRVGELMAMERAAGLYGTEIFVRFNKQIATLGEDVRKRLSISKQRTGRSLAFGTSVGCAALIQYFDLGKYLDAVFDDAPLVNYIRTSDRNIPALTGKQLTNEPPIDVLVLAWRYMGEIAAKHGDFISSGGRFYRALPDLKYFPA